MTAAVNNLQGFMERTTESVGILQKELHTSQTSLHKLNRLTGEHDADI